MRVLYTHTASLIGGGNKVLLRLFEGLDRARFQPVSVIPEPGPLEKELRRLEVPYFILDLRPARWGILSAPGMAIRLTLQVLRYRCRFLHANDPCTYRVAAAAARLVSLFRICHIHHPGQTPESLGWSLKYRPELILTPSNFMRDQVVGALGDEATIRTEAVWNPIDIDWFSPGPDALQLKTQLGLKPDGRDVIILGALAPHKGHACFLRMAERVLRRVPKARFHIVGSAKTGSEIYAKELEQLARNLGISGQTRFWGFVNDKQARDLLRMSDLFVLPSKEEGFGLSVAEAQACQVPVLTSAIRPLDEVVDDSRTGYLIPPEDHEQFAHRAIELLESEDTRRKMGEAGRSWVLSRFSGRAHVDRIMSLYQEILPKRC